MGVESPRGRDTDTLLAGNALGTMLTVERLRGFVMVRHDIVTRECIGQKGRGRRRKERTDIDSGL